MIHEWNDARTGYALFSDDRSMRYRLTRSYSPLVPARMGDVYVDPSTPRVVFVMLNPSTANAFKLDPTIKRCAEFARRWEFEIFEVVNLFALRTPYPEDVHRAARAAMAIGANEDNDSSIVSACTNAKRVIAAWGNHGTLCDRAAFVTELLTRRGIQLEALRILDSGIPSHPLARGRNFIPYDTQPVRFAP